MQNAKMCELSTVYLIKLTVPVGIHMFTWFYYYIFGDFGTHPQYKSIEVCRNLHASSVYSILNFKWLIIAQMANNCVNG